MKNQEEQECRNCGCTWNNACITEYGPCWWVKEDLCSGCTDFSSKEEHE